MVLPLLVIIGWMADKPLDLAFGEFEAWTLMLTVVTVRRLLLLTCIAR